jgi:type IV pilus assembly protein PilB
MFLLTGPTGSGKTTTLNAMLLKMNDISRNIITIEDPVEYHIEGITQVQTLEVIGLTFASALRSFLRQDPDIIMVGEMRDMETAQIAVRAALTGHLVLSTLHTNDAPSAIARLVDLGVEPYLLPGTIIGIMAQRLVRTLCPKCRESYKTTMRDLVILGYRGEDLDREITLYRPKGCADCLNTGLKGRKGLYELLMVDGEMRKLLSQHQGATLDEVRTQAKKSGMRQLREEGIDLVLKGVTTVEQVQRVVYTTDIW